MLGMTPNAREYDGKRTNARFLAYWTSMTTTPRWVNSIPEVGKAARSCGNTADPTRDYICRSGGKRRHVIGNDGIVIGTRLYAVECCDEVGESCAFSLG